MKSDNAMRKIIVANHVTIDGFFAGPNGELDWFVRDDQLAHYAAEQLKAKDALLLGRVTYQLFASYWPTPSAYKDNPILAPMLNDITKIVFSRKLDRAEWNNSRLVKENMAEEISKLKQQPGKDMVILGSGSIVSALTRLGLIDEYEFMVNPVILGRGRSQFEGLDGRLKMKLMKAEVLSSGIVILGYEPITNNS
jgi:dihydrofolate reductase